MLSGGAEENLLDVRLGDAGDAADDAAIHRRIAPAEHGETFLARDALQDAFAAQAIVAFDGEEDHADAVLAGLRELDVQAATFAGEKLVRDLDEDAGAVTGFGIATAGATMGKVDQDLDALAHDLVSAHALDAGDEADAAGIVLVARIVESLRRRQTGWRWSVHLHFFRR